MKYNYYEAMKQDVAEALKEEEDLYNGMSRDDLQQAAEDSLWINDSVTGNASGSYTFNRWKAEEYVTDNIKLAIEAFQEFGQLQEFGNMIENESWESIDVTIRCYLLPQVISAVLDEAEAAGKLVES